MTFQPQPDPLHRARGMTTNYVDAMKREAIRLEKAGLKTAASDVRAVLNAADNASGIRLRNRAPLNQD